MGGVWRAGGSGGRGSRCLGVGMVVIVITYSSFVSPCLVYDSFICLSGGWVVLVDGGCGRSAAAGGEGRGGDGGRKEGRKRSRCWMSC